MNNGITLWSNDGMVVGNWLDTNETLELGQILCKKYRHQHDNKDTSNIHLLLFIGKEEDLIRWNNEAQTWNKHKDI